MALSEFRFNKKRKHYAYLHKRIGGKRVNILISTKPVMVRGKHMNGQIKVILKNVPLFHHPNPDKEGIFYLIPINYVDDAGVFENKEHRTWCFSRHDKRKVKRIKKLKRKNRR